MLHKILRGFLISLTIFAVAAIAGCSRPLPDKGSPAELLYAHRCGSCHRPYNPHSMTAGMWQAQMQAMLGRIAESGQPPLTQAQQREIMDYLTRNAGKE